MNVLFICFCCCVDVATLDIALINNDFPLPLTLTSVPVTEHKVCAVSASENCVVVLLVSEIEYLE